MQQDESISAGEDGGPGQLHAINLANRGGRTLSVYPLWDYGDNYTTVHNYQAHANICVALSVSLSVSLTRRFTA